jgi:DNA mismatch repair protein MutL
LVKELVENSLDAGALNVTVDIKDGGRSVKVLDDGHGIESQDLAKALQRFTTSKISKADDLWALHSFGFRGEALASISSVCKLRLVSRTKSNAQASSLESIFGQVSPVESVSGPLGTEITVTDLFENIPAV